MKTQIFQVNTLKELFEFFLLDNINTDSKTTEAFLNWGRCIFVVVVEASHF